MLYIENLSFSYTGALPYILQNINLTLAKGSYLSILGENGSAKSTLMKLILGLLKPKEGTISMDSNKIAYVPQRLDGFNSQFPITVREILTCHQKALKLKDKDLLTESLERVNMVAFKDSLLGNLSGGQQQKILIARALLGNPDLLILDEPSTGIDIQSQNEIYAIIKELNINFNMTVLSVEHNLTAALKNSTHIFKLEKAQGTLYTIDSYKEEA